MSKAKRGFGADRFVAALVVSSFAIALAGCGGDDGSSSTGSTSSATPTTVADAGSTGGSGGNKTNGGSTTNTSPASTSSSSVTLGWQPPTQNTNGSPITDLAGYKIHYGKTSADYTETVSVENAGLTRYVVDNLPSGTYYFAITAYNSQGMESALSGEVATSVD